MDDNFQQPLAALQIVAAAKTGNVLALAQGIVSLLGFETNKSVVEKLVARDFEDFLFEWLMDLQRTSNRHTQRLLTVEATVDRLDFTVDELQKHLAEDLRVRMEKLEWIIGEWQDRLGPSGARPSDLVAVLEAGYRTWKNTSDRNKRDILGNALRNAFDPKRYKDGLTLRLLDTLSDLTYGEIWILQKLEENVRYMWFLKTHPEMKGMPAENLPFPGQPPGSLIEDHIVRLKAHGLAREAWYSRETDEGVTKSSPIPIPTELGGRLLRLIAADTQGDDEQIDVSSEFVYT